MPSGVVFAQSVTPPGYDVPSVICEPGTVEQPFALAMAATKNVEPSAGPANAAKSTAILGGAPSMLDQMRLAQINGSTQVGVPSVESEYAQPANTDMCSPASVSPLWKTGRGGNAILPQDIIMGSVAIAIGQTPFDKKWAALTALRHGSQTQRSLLASGARKKGDEGSVVESVNQWVNRKIAFGEDRTIYGRADYWATAGETLRRGVGDCEDFAIVKMELLSALGIARNRMKLVIARDLVRNADHAVLVVALGERSVMLDNVTDRLLDARLPNDYRPIMSFSQNAKWVHGYAVQPSADVRFASADHAMHPATGRTSDVLTVTPQGAMPAVSIALLSVPLVLPSALLTRA